MIFDTIDNAAQYFPLHPHFEAAFNWLKENPDAAEGRYEIDGDDCFVMIQLPTGGGKDNPTLEAHNQYLDIQLVLEGRDEIGWKPRADCTQVTQPYSSENDCELWGEGSDFYMVLEPGSFAVFYPQDAHAPLSGEGPLKKAVFKLRVAK